MKALLAFILVSIIAASCQIDTTTEKLKQTRDNPSFQMVVNIVPERQIQETCKKLGVSYDANGCAVFHFDSNRCEIFVMPQRWQQDEERLTIIGHEVWHCRYGQWHD